MAGSDVQSGSLQSPTGAMQTRKDVSGDGRRSEDGTWQVTLTRISLHGLTLSKCCAKRHAGGHCEFKKTPNVDTVFRNKFISFNWQVEHTLQVISIL